MPNGRNKNTTSAPSAEASKTSKELAAIAGVHANTITQAKTVQAKGAEEVVEARFSVSPQPYLLAEWTIESEMPE